MARLKKVIFIEETAWDKIKNESRKESLRRKAKITPGQYIEFHLGPIAEKKISKPADIEIIAEPALPGIRRSIVISDELWDKLSMRSLGESSAYGADISISSIVRKAVEEYLKKSI